MHLKAPTLFAALLSCLAFISASNPLPITCTPYLLPLCGLLLLSARSVLGTSSICRISSIESGVFSSSDLSVLLLGPLLAARALELTAPLVSVTFSFSFLPLSGAGLLTDGLGDRGSSDTITVCGRSDLDLDLIKLRKPLFLDSLLFFSSPSLPSSAPLKECFL